MTGLKYVCGMTQEFSTEDKLVFFIASIEDTHIYDNELARKYALDMTEKEVNQAVEAMYHNLK